MRGLSRPILVSVVHRHLLVDLWLCHVLRSRASDENARNTRHRHRWAGGRTRGPPVAAVRGRHGPSIELQFTCPGNAPAGRIASFTAKSFISEAGLYEAARRCGHAAGLRSAVSGRGGVERHGRSPSASAGTAEMACASRCSAAYSSSEVMALMLSIVLWVLLQAEKNLLRVGQGGRRRQSSSSTKRP